MFESFRSRLILLLLGLLSLMTIAIGFATLSAMQRDSQTQAEQALNVASKVFQQALANRANQLSNSVRLLASDFGFRQAVALGEQDTIASVLENHGGRIDAAISMLLSPSGALLASSALNIEPTQVAELFQDMQNAGVDSYTDIVQFDNQAYQMVMVPVKAPQLIAWVGMGFALDQQLAQQIKGITDLDISFVLQRPQKAVEILTSTLSTAQFNTLANTTAAPQNDIANQMLSTSLMLDQHQRIQAWLHLSTQRWAANYQQARAQLIAIFGLGLALATLFAVLMARGISEPLRQLTEFARDIGRGNQPATPKLGGGEIGLLGLTLSTMQSDIRQREQQIVFQSQHDTLTGLANRTLAELQLPDLLLNDNHQLLLINIKDFKHINDAFGYANGDLLLQQLAQRLTHCSLTVKLLVRLGGDEFLLVHDQPLNLPELAQLQASLSQDFVLAESKLNLKLAIAAINIAAASISANDALRRVDIAMVHAKSHNHLIAEYQPGQDESHQRELTLLQDLTMSLQQGHMFVVYQPKVSLQSRTAVSAEALIRWQHPTLGFVPPDEFIFLAEHSGLISRITDWMINQVLQQLATWYQQGVTVTVAVNLSAYDLLNTELPQQLAALLLKYQLPASALALEVTEGAVMQDPQQVIQNLQQLRQMGIELAIDDFGTGQSSLAYLKQLPVHEVKIDRAFIKDIEHNQNDALIVNTTTQMAHGLGLLVTAEGLENQAGLTKLYAAGVDKVQGYYFSKPLKAADFSQWLTEFSTEQSRWFGEVE